VSQAGTINSSGGDGGGSNIQKINVQTGISPVVPTANTITFNGATVLAGTHPVRTDGTALSTMALEVQLSQAIASTNASNVGLSAFNSSEFTVDANGFVSLVGGTGPSIETITPNFGGPVSPVGGNINDQGLAANPGGNAFPVFSYNGGNPNVLWENRAYLTPYVVDHSTTDGSKGTFTTIQAAITQAAADGFSGTIFVRPGVYNETLTMAAGINLASFVTDGSTPSVSVNGQINCSYSGVCTITGLYFGNTANTFVLSNSGASLALIDCFLNQQDSGVPAYMISGFGNALRLINCEGNMSFNGNFFNISGLGNFYMFNCNFLASFGGSHTSFISNANSAIYNVQIFYSTLFSGLTLSEVNAQFFYSQIGNPGSTGVIGLTLTNSTAVQATTCAFSASEVVAASIDATSSLECADCTFTTDSSTLVTNAGSFTYDVVTQSSNTHSNGQQPLIKPTRYKIAYFSNVNFQNGQVVNITTPGAYPYTTLITDYMVLVDTSGGARTINLLATPTTGTTFRIKDNAGNAFANNITITPAAGNIDGAATYVLNMNYASADVVYNGTQWNVL
jgi:hypothetical protein